MEAAGRQEPARSGERSGTHSGRLLLRMPEELHAELARRSESKGISLNAFITATLASAVGWRDGAALAGRSKRTRQSVAQVPPRKRLVERLLIVNLLVVAAVGVLAIVLIVQTLH